MYKLVIRSMLVACEIKRAFESHSSCSSQRLLCGSLTSWAFAKRISPGELGGSEWYAHLQKQVAGWESSWVPRRIKGHGGVMGSMGSSLRFLYRPYKRYLKLGWKMNSIITPFIIATLVVGPALFVWAVFRAFVFDTRETRDHCVFDFFFSVQTAAAWFRILEHHGGAVSCHP